MKSVKAKEYIESLPCDESSAYVSLYEVCVAVELAEQETEVRMRKKAKEAFMSVWRASNEEIAEACGVPVDEITSLGDMDKYSLEFFLEKLYE
nr:MAG TPA: Protein of unknown function (DUF2802) [Caudoviricetes sp.]